NCIGSSLARESDGVLYTHAGPEIGVASTKAYTAQLMMFYILALKLAAVRKTLSPLVFKKFTQQLVAIPKQLEKILKRRSSIQKIRADKCNVIAVGTEGDKDIKRHSDYVLEIPATDGLLSPLLVVLPLQFLAYYIAVKRGNDVDQPRNLAKSVTVE